MGADLNSLDKLVGQYVTTSRPRTPLEEKAYGGPGTEGGSGLVTEIGPLRSVTITFGGETETLTGRDVCVDWGMAWLITEDTTVQATSGDAYGPYHEDGAHCCRGECCGAGSWCCAHAGYHTHDPDGAW